jgi:hypothetical protein
MKSLFESTLNWFKRGKEEDTCVATPVPEILTTENLAVQPVLTVPAAEPAPVPAFVPHIVPSQPPSTPAAASTAPELILKSKAGTMYATCPHCSGTWNLRERLMRPRRSGAANELTCPACDQPVSVRLETLGK